VGGDGQVRRRPCAGPSLTRSPAPGDVHGTLQPPANQPCRPLTQHRRSPRPACLGSSPPEGSSCLGRAPTGQPWRKWRPSRRVARLLLRATRELLLLPRLASAAPATRGAQAAESVLPTRATQGLRLRAICGLPAAVGRADASSRRQNETPASEPRCLMHQAAKPGEYRLAEGVDCRAVESVLQVTT
jgi:hypothetical protein